MAPARARFWIRSFAFCLMFAGVIIAWRGLDIVSSSYGGYSGAFSSDPTHRIEAEQRERGYFIRDIGVDMALSAPVIWAVSNLILWLRRSNGPASR